MGDFLYPGKICYFTCSTCVGGATATFFSSGFQILLKLQSDFVIWICIQILADQKEIYADLSPQDSTLLSDIVEVGSLPSVARESDETWHSFYILTRQGLRYECSSKSEVQVISLLFIRFIVFYFLINLSECFCKHMQTRAYIRTHNHQYIGVLDTHINMLLLLDLLHPFQGYVDFSFVQFLGMALCFFPWLIEGD